MPMYDHVQLCGARSTNSMEDIVHISLLSEVHLEHSCPISFGVIGGKLTRALLVTCIIVREG